jgi:NADH-quinone oxidoreductase subunit N
MNVTVGLADILLISPLIALFVFSLIPLTGKVLAGNKEQNPAANLIVALIGLILAGGLMLIFHDFNNQEQVGRTVFNGQLIFDGLTQWAGMIALISAAGGLVLLYENPSTNLGQFSEIVFLTLNAVVGMLVLVSSVHLLTMFIGLEMMSLCLYLLIALSQEQRISKEAAIKYFILGSFASAIFLFGVSFVFGSTNTVNITDLVANGAQLVATNKLFLFGISFIIIGFCFKVSLVPFHAWTPDVYQGSPTPITSFMATAVKTVSFAAFLRVVATQALSGSQNLFDVLQWLAVITMTAGNVAALVQTNFKRTLAYSSIAHSGYLMVGLIASGISQTSAYSVTSVLVYLLTYSVMTLGAFGVLSLVEKTENSSISNEDFSGFAKKSPVLALCLTVFLLSLAGLPPTLGFFGKFYLFSAAVSEGLIWLALWGVINSVISVYFYLRPIIMMYMKDGDATVAARPQQATTVVVVFSALFIVIVGLFSGPLFKLFENSFG